MVNTYVEPSPITEEEREIQMGEKPPEKVADTTEKEPDEKGTGTLADAPTRETEKPVEEAQTTETKTTEPEKLTEEEKKDIEKQGFKIETDKKERTYITDAEGTKIPEKRFSKIYREGKEAQSLRQENETLKQKQTLFRQLGQDEYYRLYPDEKPEGYKPPEPKRVEIPTGGNELDLVVKGGTYEGMTLRDVMTQDAAEGTRMLSEYYQARFQASVEQTEKVTNERQQQDKDALDFGNARAKELFGIDLSTCTPEQTGKIYLISQEVLDWSKKNGCLGLSWNHAYKLMKHDEIVANASQKAREDAIKGLQKAGPGSIDTGKGGDTKPTGWEAVSSMSPEELSKHIDGLDDAGLQKFLKEAPASIKGKHPEIPWKN